MESKRINRHLFSAVIIACFIFSFFRAVNAQEEEIVLNPTGRDLELASLLKVSDTVLGEALITITADNQIELPKESTITLLTSLVSPKALEQLARSPNPKRLNKQDFQDAGLDLFFDLSTLECIISVPTEVGLVRNISLEQRGGNFDYLEPALLSGYLNVSAYAATSQSIDAERERIDSYSARFDAGLTLGRVNLEYESALENDTNNSSIYIRKGTRLNYDIPNQGTRIVVGDMYNSGKLLQDASDVLGIGITRDFTLIPTRNVRPKANQSFTLQRTSSVDVVVDGVVVQRLTLGAGSYNLNDIPLAQGNNDVQLVITDSSGAQEQVQFSIATGNDLLAVGEFEYSLMYGVPSQRNQTQIEYLRDQTLLHGYIDVGVTPWLTAGINGQMREDLHQYGSTLLFASSWGVTELSSSFSQHPELGAGSAYRVAFDATFDSNQSVRPQFSLIYEYQSENFAGIRSYGIVESPLNSIRHYASAFGSLYLVDNVRSALSISYSSGSRPRDEYVTISPSLSGPFFATPATWSTRVNYRDNFADSDEWYATVTLSWPFGKTTRLVSRYNSANDQASLDYSYQNNIGNTGGVSSFASIVRNRDSDANVDFGVNYTGNQFVAIADHTTRVDNISDNVRSHNTRIEVSSALAFAGSSVAIGRPVRDAFAVIDKHSSLEENRMAIEPARDGEHARVFGIGKQSVLVPDLVAYNPRLLTYDVEDLPPGYDLGDGAFWLNPGYKQGYELQIGSDAVITIIGTLLDKDTKEPIALIAGKAFSLEEQSDPIEFFTNRNGLFAISGLKPGKLKLLLSNDDQQSVTINLNPNSELLVRLGDLYAD
ncbi:fimbria/pilus outer membrane usher protein [Vibrio sinaloensis]|uniref:fimbria/pilus outer membrane usher protein n=1 Tax=Photobacterium sp. (strain ATCC 43367) TaxID=379097 RepID=UPI0009DF3A6A